MWAVAIVSLAGVCYFVKEI